MDVGARTHLSYDVRMCLSAYICACLISILYIYIFIYIRTDL